MCRGGRTDLLLLQMAVRSVVCLLFRVGSDVLILANFTSFGSSTESCRMLPQKAATRAIK